MAIDQRMGPTQQRIVRIPKPKLIKSDSDTGALQKFTDRYYSEDQILDFLGIDNRILSLLRYRRGLPFITIYRGYRLYRAESLFDWLNKQEITLGVMVDDYEMFEEER